MKVAAAGFVDAGAGTGAANNTLVLQDNAGNNGPATSIGWSNYVGFQRLTVNSGTWNLQGPWSGTGAITLGGGLVNFNSNTSFGSGLFTVNGGTIAASGAGLALGNNFTLNNALTLGGTQGFALNGVLSGGGGLTISNTGW